MTNRSMLSVITKADQRRALRRYEELLDEHRWGIYRVRRIYTRKGKAARAVEQVETNTRQAVAALFQIYTRRLEHETVEGITYAYKRRREPDTYPAFEEFIVAAPATVRTKARGGIPAFDEKWARATGSDSTIIVPGRHRGGQTTLFA